MTSGPPAARKIVVFGMMSKIPVAGVVWQTVHYLVGFERLGYEVYYVEEHGITPRVFWERETDDGWARAAAFIEGVMRRFGFADRWAFHPLYADGRRYGLSREKLRRLYRDSALLVNLHGATIPLPEHAASGRLVYLETDPVEVQVQLHDNVRETVEYLEPHAAFFTFAENYGNADCALPVSERFHFRPTRQPVVLDLWAGAPGPPRDVFTTVGNWRQGHRRVRLDGEAYTWSKHHEFVKFLDLPARTGQSFELALSSYTDEDRQLLESHGWNVRHALDFSLELDDYRDYVAGSKGEFTVAKDQNVRLRTGWFSDRSATYLAAGRPVVTQETGFSNVLPSEAGLLGFSSFEEAAESIARVRADYGLHAEAASSIAREWFDAEVVLGSLLDTLALPRSGPRFEALAMENP